MALIRNASPKSEITESGYYRLIGDERMAKLLQVSQSTVISNGTELEHIIADSANVPVINDVKNLDGLIELYNTKTDCHLPSIKISKKDFAEVGIKLVDKQNLALDGVWILGDTIYVTEIKEGHHLDTKKSSAEVKHMRDMIQLLNYKLPSATTVAKIVLWNLSDITKHSIKTINADDYVVTGAEFSSWVDLDFDAIQSQRKQDQKENRDYFIEELWGILETLS